MRKTLGLLGLVVVSAFAQDKKIYPLTEAETASLKTFTVQINELDKQINALGYKKRVIESQHIRAVDKIRVKHGDVLWFLSTQSACYAHGNERYVKIVDDAYAVYDTYWQTCLFVFGSFVPNSKLTLQ